MENKEILEKINVLEKEDKIAFMTTKGLMEANIKDIIKRPIDELLYDLNRDKATLTTMANSKSLRWVNDIALVNVLKYVMQENAKLYKKLEDLKLELSEYAKNPFKNSNELGTDKAIPAEYGHYVYDRKDISKAETFKEGFINTDLEISM